MPLTGRDITFTLALCVSLVAHALVLGTAAEIYNRTVGNHIHLPGFGYQPLPIDIEEDTDPRNRLGDPDGHGKAILPSTGDAPTQARQGFQDQPLLSRDPVGPGKIGDDPSESVLPPGQPVERAAAPSQQPTEELAAAAPFGVPAPPGNLAEPFGVKAVPPVPDPQPKTDQAPAKPSPPQPNAAVGAARSSPSTRAADPAPLGESDSDPIATIGSAKFYAGAMDVRLGRKWKLTRPHLSLAAEAAIGVLPNPTVVLKIHIDKTGKVIAADVFRSSGSSAVDQPCVLAAYEWWFEPYKDTAGRPINDVITFSIHFL